MEVTTLTDQVYLKNNDDISKMGCLTTNLTWLFPTEYLHLVILGAGLGISAVRRLFLDTFRECPSGIQRTGK